MAIKKDKPDPENLLNNFRYLAIRVSENAHRRIKQKAIDEKISMARVVRGALRKYGILVDDEVVFTPGAGIKKDCATQKILALLRDGKSITPSLAREKFAVTELTSIIRSLRAQGHEILTLLPGRKNTKRKLEPRYLYISEQPQEQR